MAGLFLQETEQVQLLPSIPHNDGQSLLTSGGRPLSTVKSPQEKHSQEYGVFTLKDGRGYLIPLGSRRAALGALDLYNTQNRKASIAKRLLQDRAMVRYRAAVFAEGPPGCFAGYATRGAYR